MTTQAKGLRRRRRSNVNGLPEDLVAWFRGDARPEGKQGAPWSALIYPDYYLLPERWRIWKATHPRARPPAGWEWIDIDPPFRGHAAEIAANLALRYLGRGG
jgi:hypothetical protein